MGTDVRSMRRRPPISLGFAAHISFSQVRFHSFRGREALQAFTQNPLLYFSQVDTLPCLYLPVQVIASAISKIAILRCSEVRAESQNIVFVRVTGVTTLNLVCVTHRTLSTLTPRLVLFLSLLSTHSKNTL